MNHSVHHKRSALGLLPYRAHSRYAPCPCLENTLALAPLPANKNVKLVVTCEHGHLAQLAKGLLYTLGYQYVSLLNGHTAEWKISGRPLEK